MGGGGGYGVSGSSGYGGAGSGTAAEARRPSGWLEVHALFGDVATRGGRSATCQRDDAAGAQAWLCQCDLKKILHAFRVRVGHDGVTGTVPASVPPFKLTNLNLKSESDSESTHSA